MQFSAARGILSLSAAFASGRGISMFSRNFAEFGTGITLHFSRFQVAVLYVAYT